MRQTLSDAIREVDDPMELAFRASEILGTTLGVSRAGYGVVETASETITVERDWTMPGVASLAGVLRFRDYGSYIEDLKRGEIVAFPDARQDPRTAKVAAALEALDARAMLNLPVGEKDGFVALLYLNHAEVRDWLPDEVSLVREVAERVQVAVQRRRAERELKALAASLERQVDERTRERDQLWALSEDLLVTANYDGRFLRLIPSWTWQLGWDELELLDTDYARLVHPDELEGSTRAVRHMRVSGTPVRFENRMRHKDGSWHWISWQLSPEPGGERLTGTGRDVTADKARQADLEVAQESLRQSQKMEAVGQLTGGVAHDFNNLLTVIRSSVDLLKRPNLTEERRQRYVGAISDTATRAAKLTGQLLAFYRRQALKPEVFDVNGSVEGIRDMIGTLTGSRIRIDLVTSTEDCRISADPSQFDTALVNMAVNARDAMGGEGILTMTVGRASVLPARRAHGSRTGEFVMASISDTGTGIASADLDRIFEPFFTTKGVGQGTGLGLSQVFGFAKQSGGEVVVESELGRGTTFTLYLPYVEERERSPVEGDTEGVEDGSGRRVLVVEDNVDVGTFAIQTLAELGYVPALATNGEEALAILGSNADRFDAVFSDVIMPGMGGIELGSAVRHLYPDLPFVLTSGYSHVLAQEGTHGFDLLHKPYSIGDLSRILARAARPTV